jgi:hypothetical protein
MVWELAGGKEILRTNHEGGQPTFLTFSPEGTRLAAGDGWTVTILDAATGDRPPLVHPEGAGGLPVRGGLQSGW